MTLLFHGTPTSLLQPRSRGIGDGIAGAEDQGQGTRGDPHSSGCHRGQEVRWVLAQSSPPSAWGSQKCLPASNAAVPGAP